MLLHLRLRAVLGLLALTACDEPSPECAALRDYDACVSTAESVDDLHACDLEHLPHDQSLGAVAVLNVYVVEGGGDIVRVRLAAETRLRCE